MLKEKRKYILITLVLIEFFSLFLSWKSFSNKEVDKIKEENKVNNKGFSVYVNNGSGKYTEYNDSTLFPEGGYELNIEKSNCVGTDGKVVENVLSTSGTNITITSPKTVYCYLYFDLTQLCGNGDYLGSCLISKKEKLESLNDNVEGGLYRYQGTNEVVNDNYVCFGTNNKEECVSDTDKYMYRIMGINEQGQVKLIKKEALNTAYYWYRNATTNKTWPDSDLYKGLNAISGGNYSNLFIGNATYMPIGWKNKIANYDWKYGDNTNVKQDASALYATENAWTNTINAKIGLMYMHDYIYGLPGGNDCSPSGVYSTCKTSWLFITNSDSAVPSEYEWTMSRYGKSGSSVYAWFVEPNGIAGNYYLNTTSSVRPVFYLNSDEAYVSGSGTIDDPIMLSEPDSQPIGDYLLENPTTGLNTTTAYSGMYRYIGKTANNYVKLSDGTNEVLYRIIGIVSEDNNTLGLEKGQLKLIKAESIGNYWWHTGSNVNIKWASSAMYEYLQGQSVLGNVSIIPNGWRNKISSVKWYTGEVQTLTNGKTVFELEDDSTTFSPAKVGLMYLSDYYYAYNAGGTRNCYSSSCANWLSDTSNNTWTMTYYGLLSSGYRANYIETDNTTNRYALTYEYAVRPTFYLNSDIKITNPEAAGTIDDPFIITNEPVIEDDDTTPKPISETLLENPTKGLNPTTAYSGMYRYTGTVAYNYVKLSDGTNEVLYRIIGIVSEDNETLGLQAGQVKLRKADISEAYNWHTSATTNTRWTSSAIYKYLQGTNVLGNTSIIPSGWSDKISAVNWNIGDVSTSYTSGSTVYDLEASRVTGTTSKIGLIYLSDYYYAASEGGTQSCYSTLACVNWMTPAHYDWTMTRYGIASDSNYQAWYTYNTGNIQIQKTSYGIQYRPVFYLNKDVIITNPRATGTDDDPFIIE